MTVLELTLYYVPGDGGIRTCGDEDFLTAGGGLAGVLGGDFFAGV